VATSKAKTGKKNKIEQFDILISGGGMVGLTLACGLAVSGFDVAVVDIAAPDGLLDKGFDGRSSAIAFASYKMLDALAISPFLKDKVQPIDEIRVTDSDVPLFLHFDKQELGDGPLGYMVENRHNRQALFKRLAQLSNITLFAPDSLDTHEIADGGGVEAKLKSGKTLSAKLLVAAEGRQSPLREGADIGLVKADYHQVGIVATIEHEHPHLGIAHERFLPDGPFAILPLTGNRSSLVWSVGSDVAPEILKLSTRAIEAEIQKRIGGFLGEIKVAGPRWSYPLSMQFAERYCDDRMVLVGDAAHGIHPIAGQGLNLGYRDVAALLEVLNTAKLNGEDIGSDEVLENYAKWRRFDNMTLIAAMDGLTRLFSNNIKPLKYARAIGLEVVNHIPPLRKFFMHHARGTVGDLPLLLEGKNLPTDLKT
jgi:2-octaprenyl-6-methoxyphenol hydroxylase